MGPARADAAVARRERGRAAAAAARAGDRQAAARRRARSSRGKHILLIGTTGFVGKVALSMLLHRYPDVGKVYCLVRPGAGNTADERFFKKVATERGVRSAARCPRRRLRGVPALEDRRARRRHRPPALQLHRRAVRRGRQHGGVDVDHQQRRPGVVRAVARERAAHQRDGRQERARPRAQARRTAVSRVDLLRRGPARGRRVGGRADRRLLPALEHDLARLGQRGRAPRSRLRSRRRDRRLPEDHRPGARAVERSPAHLRVPRAWRRGAARAAPRSRRRERSQDRRRPRAQDLDERRPDQARHGARRALGLDQHVHVHEVARRADHPRATARSRRRSCAPRSSRARCATRSRAGTRASTRPRR